MVWNPIICHEMPPAAESLGWGREFNDYDYVLLHLLDDPAYREWAMNCDDRILYLDNSCYELGASLDNMKLARAVIDLCPDRFFLPDVMGDGAATRKRSEEFIKQFPGLPRSIMVGVAQGDSMDDIITSYMFFLEQGVGMIAFPFMYPWMKGSSALAHASERVDVLRHLLKIGCIDTNMKHHLLGTHHISEFLCYHDYDWITSIDTSNPVMAAFDKVAGGLNALLTPYPPENKPKANLASVWEATLPPTQMVRDNVNIFREYCGRKKDMKIDVIHKTGRPAASADTINPRHYKIIIDGKEIQVADIIDALQLNWKRAFSVKYMLRAGDKPEQGMTQEEKELDDLQKGMWYLQREIDELKKKLGK